MLRSPGMVAGWMMEGLNSSSKIPDISGNNYHLTPTGVTFPDSTFGKCMYVGGAANGTVTAAGVVLSALTYCFWYYGGPNSAQQRMINCAWASAPYTGNMTSVHLAAASAAYGSQPANTIGLFDYSNANCLYATWNAAWTNKWTHFTFTRTAAGYIIMYVNAVPYVSGTKTVYLGTVTNINIGCGPVGYYGCYGYFDGVYIFNKALDVQNIKRIMCGLHALN